MNITIKQVRGNSGADIWADNLCEGLHQSGHKCSVNLYSLAYQFLPALARIQQTSSASDIVQGNSWNAFAFKSEAPLVVTAHHVIDDPLFNPHKTLLQNGYHRWIYRCEGKSLNLADAVICVSNFTRKRLKEVYGISDAHVIHNGIDTSVFKPKVPGNPPRIPEGKTVIFFAGNLSKRKGGDLLPPIMEQLGDRFVLLLATTNDSQKLTPCRTIQNLGNLTPAQLVDTYNRCDIFLSASRLEGFGLSVAEAMACGKPVVATNCSSLPELVVDGKGGFLCKMDDVKDFVKKIRHLAGDEVLRREMGRFNRKRAEELFTLEKMVNNYIGVYQALR